MMIGCERALHNMCDLPPAVLAFYAVPTLLSLLNKDESSSAESNSVIRNGALRVMACLDAHVLSTHLPTLVPFLSDKDATAVRLALSAFCKVAREYRALARPWLDRIVQLACDPVDAHDEKNCMTRVWAVRVLIQCEPGALSTYLPSLVPILSESSSHDCASHRRLSEAADVLLRGHDLCAGDASSETMHRLHRRRH